MRRGALIGAALVTVLATGSAAAVPDGAPVPWSTLRRPLHLPRIAGSACPVSRVDPSVPWKRIDIFGGSGTGPGPAYPGLGARGGHVLATRDVQDGGPWFGDKIFWYVRPSYRGRVLVRGRQLDGPQLVRFDGGRLPRSELHLEAGETVFWQGQPGGSRGVPSAVRLVAPGCYAFQIDGTTFSRVVVFTADLAR
jgi:hypothetical protein